MPVTKLTCPECEAVLRPNKPIPEGKTIKCPKCGSAIVVQADPAEAISAKKPAAQKSAARTTQAPAKAPSKVPPPSPSAEPPKISDDDDEEDGRPGIYSLAQEPEAPQKPAPKKRKPRVDEDGDFEDEDEDEDGDEEEAKNDVLNQYLTDTKTKDPRGPAQEMLVSPSNWLMLVGILGAIGYAACILLALWPFIFPPDEDKKDDPNQKPVSLKVGPAFNAVNIVEGKPIPPLDKLPAQKQGGSSGGGGPGGTPPGGGAPGGGAPGGGTPGGNQSGSMSSGGSLVNEKDQDEPSKTTVLFFDMGDLGYADTLVLCSIVFAFMLGIAYNAVIVYCSVKMQMMESRTLGLIGSTFAIIPGVSGMGVFIIVALITLFLLRMLLDMLDVFDTSGTIMFIFWYSLAVMLIAIFAGTVSGIRGFVTLSRPEVIAGFEFKAD